MDRPNLNHSMTPARARTLVAGGLAALLLISVGTGCRSAGSDVPPGRPFDRTGKQMPAVGFSSEPHPPAGASTAPTTMGSAYGAPGGAPSAMTNYGAPTGNGYGPTSTAGAVPGGMGAVGRGSEANAMPSQLSGGGGLAGLPGPGGGN